MTPRSRSLGRALLLSLITLTLFSTNAFAQDSSEEQSLGVSVAVVGLLSITSTSFVGTTQANLREKKLRKKKDELESLVLIDHYLNHYEDETRFAFAIGGGRGLDDIAILMGCEDLDRAKRGEVRAQNKLLAAALALDEDPDGTSLNRARAIYNILDPIFFPDDMNDQVAEVAR